MRRALAILLLALFARPSSAASYGVQVGAFREFERAEQIQSALEDAGYTSYFSEADGYKRVRIGPYPSRAKAEEEARSLWPFLVARFGPKEFERSWVVEEDREIENAPVRREDSPAPVFPVMPSLEREPSGLPLLDDARSFIGVPYRWGGTTGDGFDCSGFVQTIFARAGYALPRQAKNQIRVGEPVPDEEIAPGDLVFFSTYARGASHVGIYLGNGEFIHASSGEGAVTVTPLSKRYYVNRYLGARRVLTLDPGVLRQMTDLVNR